MKAIVCNKIFDGERVLKNHAVICDGDHIHSVVTREQISVEWETEVHKDGMLVPGFVDLQVNGGGGALFNENPSVETISTMSAAHRRFGTTSFTPTLISDSYQQMLSSRTAAANAMADLDGGVLGIHFEGPFLNPVKRGAHIESNIRTIRPEDVELLVDDFPGEVIVTIAPETISLKTIESLCAANVKVCVGHSNATYEQAADAIRAGATCFTHLYNAMSGLSARKPGVIGAALESDNTWCGLIVDGVHVHPAALKIALASKPKGKCFLVTDAMPTVGSTTDEFVFFGEPLSVRNGKIVNRDGVLSGSHLNMATAVFNAVALLGVRLEEAVRMASLYPAEFLGVADRLGRIREGYQADLILLDDEMRVLRSWKNGRAREPLLPDDIGRV